MKSRNEYDAFGVQTATNANNIPTNNSIGYTGQRLDYETNLMALGNGERYYSPTLARFIQQDSFAGLKESPQSLNRFSYVVNNPTKHTDPSGHIAPLIILGVLLVGALVGGGYSYASQRAKIADGTIREEDFSWETVIHDAGVGGAFALGAIVAATALPVTIPLMIGAGVILGGKQIIDGAVKYEYGKKNEGAVDIVFGTVNLVLSLLGARSYIKAKIPLAENISPSQKQLTDGGAGNRKLLNAAPDEVVNPTRQRLLGDGGVQQRISTGKLLPERSSVGNSANTTEMPQISRSTKLDLLKKVREATQSADPDIRLEGQVARRFRDQLVDFQHKYWGKKGEGSIAEIDVELNNSIIEVTNGQGGKKVGQIEIKIPKVNLQNKPVYLYGPNIVKRGLIKDLHRRGIKLFKNLDDLEKEVK